VNSEENKENEPSADITASPKLPLPIIGPITNHEVVVNRVETPLMPTPVINSIQNIRKEVNDKLKDNPELTQSCETPASKFAREILESNNENVGNFTTDDLLTKSPRPSTFEFSYSEVTTPEGADMTVDTLELIGGVDSALSTPKSTEEIDLLESRSETPEPHPVVSTVTPGPTAVKKLFDDHKYEMATPNQTSMKTLEQKNEIKTPNQAAMKKMFEEKGETEMKTPNQAAMKTIFGEEKQTKTPSHIGVREIFMENKTDLKTPG